jgi:hypothetical protein
MDVLGVVLVLVRWRRCLGLLGLVLPWANGMCTPDTIDLMHNHSIAGILGIWPKSKVGLSSNPGQMHRTSLANKNWLTQEA